MPNSPTFFQLDSCTSSLVIANPATGPVLTWFGDRLNAQISAEMLSCHDDTAHAFATLDARAPLTLFPQSATGYMGSAGLIGHRQNSGGASHLVCQQIIQSGNSITLTYKDNAQALTLVKIITLDQQSDVASIETTLTNDGPDDYNVAWLASATLPLATHLSQLISQHGRWGMENQSHQRNIGPGRIDISNQHGRTGHAHAPNLICASEDLSVDCGDCLFVHLGWSGNYSFKVERLQDGNGYIQAGVLLQPGEEVLGSGESLHCPPVNFTAGTGLNQCSQRFHRFARNNILPAWTRQPRPIHANSWEAMYFDLNDTDLNALVDAAAKIGAERFILDDGWFINRRSDNAGLGDWMVDESVFPNRLAPLAKHIRSHNMQFGLWFEPEMVNPDSKLYREHPDWVLQHNDIETPLARNQLVLDIANKTVADYLFKHIDQLVSEYQIDYIKWDMNRDLVLAGDGKNSRANKQPPAVYALMQRLIDAHPKLEIESCASGGARCDFGVLKHTGRVWTSDNIDPLARASIQQGFMRFFPPEIMGAHVGHLHAHLTGRSTNLHTRAIIALQGQFGFELDARVLDENDVATLHHYTSIYKAHRAWLANATYWQLPTSYEQLYANCLVSESMDEALVSIVVLDSLQATRPGCQRMRGLQPDKRYRISMLSNNLEQLIPFNKVMPEWCSNDCTSTGELLTRIGLSLPVMPPQSALLVHCVLEPS